jgi:hypothetical protein
MLPDQAKRAAPGSLVSKRPTSFTVLAGAGVAIAGAAEAGVITVAGVGALGVSRREQAARTIDDTNHTSDRTAEA